MQRKIKVVWICHFSNESIRKKLPLSKLILFNFFKRIFRKSTFNYSDYAPWVNNLIIEFKKMDNIELHIIAPHGGLKTKIFEFDSDGISYHFYQRDYPFPLDVITDIFLKKHKQKFSRNRKIVRNLVSIINPDIINLIGSENPTYSASALDIDDIPIYLSVQTVYTNPNRMSLSGELDKTRWNIEYKLHKKILYYGCTGRMHRDLVLNNNPDAIILKHTFAIEKPAIKKVLKEFDFAFFAQKVSAKKGIEDSIRALAIVKKYNENVSLNVIGELISGYGELIKNLIKELDLEQNIIFTDYFPIHAEMHQQVQKSKIALLPIKLDVISGTVIEAALLEIPIVTYKTTGTPYLNREKECVLISEIGDINGLANNMIKLLNDEEYAKQLAINAKEFASKTFDNATSAKKLVEDYIAILNHYHNGTTIPEKLLFDLNEFPQYK